MLPGAGNGNGGDPQNAEIKAVIDVPESVTSQSRHSLLLQGSPPSGKLLIPLARRDVRVVEGARLESVCRGNSTEGSNPSLSAKSILCFQIVTGAIASQRAMNSSLSSLGREFNVW